MDHRVITKKLNNDIPSPCTGVCTMDLDNQYCLGCFRTRMEIGGWALMQNDEKITVIKELRKRRRAAEES